tara:strand:+ start:1720 stop:3246 length:1527 start_codon:yes stop_codon:yes gene_type:complete
MAEPESTKNPQQIIDYKVYLRNYFGELTEVTPVVSAMNIYESIFSLTNSCDIIIADAVGFTQRLPLIGDEHIIITYRSNTSDKIISRSFKVYKIGKRVEGAQRQENYILHGISEYAIFNEFRNIDKSFRGRKTSDAIQDAFYNGFRASGGADGDFILGVKSLHGLNKDNIVKSESTTSFIPPGITPFECIKYLMDECRHPKGDNNSDYVFFEDYDGFHFTTMKELKDQDTSQKFLLGDQAFVKDEAEFEESQIIMSLKAKKSFDRLQDLGTGLFRNRVAVVDPLTKKYDSRTFIYYSEFGLLNKIHEFGGRIITAQSHYRLDKADDSSTHTRFFAAELNTTSLNTGEDVGFSPRAERQNGILTGDVSNYMDHPYINEVNKQTLISKDPLVSNPQIKQRKLGRRIAERATMDAVILEALIPGNSVIKPGDMVEIYVPQTTSTESNKFNFNLFYGQSEEDKRFTPRFLVTSVRQNYDNETQNYQTGLELMKDSYAQRPEKVYTKSKGDMA